MIDTGRKMEFINLNSLRENDLKLYPQSEIIKVIKALEDYFTSVSDESLVDATESFDTYCAFVKIIEERVNSDKTLELSNSSKTRLLNRIKAINERIGTFSKINSFIRSRFDKLTQDTAQTQKEMEGLLSGALAEFKNEELRIEEELKNSEHNILTHVLTLLGVFSAIIVTIMSVVITSSSWLNSAGGDGGNDSFCCTYRYSCYRNYCYAYINISVIWAKKC